MRIGSLKLDSNLVLAPMAGVNCAAFRLLCREFGAGLVSTPMIVTNQLVASPEKIIERTCFLKREKPISVQLVGSDPVMAAEATRIIGDYADVIDLNMGCPERDILALKAGSFLVKHPEQMEKAIKPVIDNTNKPVTAKIRVGWDDSSINTIESVKILNDLGVDAIAVHGRTKKQKYAGKADWGEIRRAKEASNVPIIGNGDVFKPGAAKAMIEQTKCDFVMIGRGSIGNPFIFERANSLLVQGKNVPEPADGEKKKAFMKFLDYYENYESMRSFSELRQHAMWFTKGLNNSKELRRKLVKMQTVEQILGIYNF